MPNPFPNYPHQPGIGYQHVFVFEGGSLTIYAQSDRAGSGKFAFNEDDLDYEYDTEGGAPVRSLKVDQSELIALRDKLLEAFPLVTASETRASQDGGGR